MLSVRVIPATRRALNTIPQARPDASGTPSEAAALRPQPTCIETTGSAVALEDQPERTDAAAVSGRPCAPRADRASSIALGAVRNG